MLNRIRRHLESARMERQVALALARGAATAAARNIDPTSPQTWEFSAFSQNGEDGILDYLSRRLSDPARTFAEVGAANGFQNNTAWFAYARKYRGTMIDGDPSIAERANRMIAAYSLATHYHTMFVTLERIQEVLSKFPDASPDIFSLDIDGNDFHIVRALVESGMRPGIVIVEYNSAFGPSRPVTIPYQADFMVSTAHPSGLYYGASLQAWRSLLEDNGYSFVTVDTNGVNAVFVEPARFERSFLGNVRGVQFAENFYQASAFGSGWEQQSRQIEMLPLETV